jgi:hypothetical protein
LYGKLKLALPQMFYMHAKYLGSGIIIIIIIIFTCGSLFIMSRNASLLVVFTADTCN